MDDVRERCRWSGPPMALGRISHDVQEQRGSGHLANSLGLPQRLPLWLEVPLVSHINDTWSRGASHHRVRESSLILPLYSLHDYSRLTLRSFPSTSPHLRSPRSSATAFDRALSLLACPKLSFSLMLTAPSSCSCTLLVIFLDSVACSHQGNASLGYVTPSGVEVFTNH